MSFFVVSDSAKGTSERSILVPYSVGMIITERNIWQSAYRNLFYIYKRNKQLFAVVTLFYFKSNQTQSKEALWYEFEIDITSICSSNNSF